MTHPETYPLEDLEGIPAFIQLTPKTGRLNPDYVEALINKALKTPANLTAAETALIKKIAKLKP